MKKLKRILLWPASVNLARVPWFVTLWRLVWVPVMTIGAIVTAIGIFGAYLSWQEVKKFWRAL